MAQNATTMWEYWGNSATTFNSGLNSYNHIMYGGSGAWYYSTLAGLQRATGSRSWTNLLIAPPATPAHLGGVTATLSWVNASVDTPMGLVSSSWRLGTGSDSDSVSAAGGGNADKFGVLFSLNVTLPPNSHATVLLPTVSPAASVTVTEGKRTVWKGGSFVAGTGGVTGGSVGFDGITVAFSVLSGSYEFASTLPRMAQSKT